MVKGDTGVTGEFDGVEVGDSEGYAGCEDFQNGGIVGAIVDGSTI